MWPFNCLSKEEKALLAELARKAKMERERPLRNLLSYTPFTFTCGRASFFGGGGAIITSRYDADKELTVDVVAKVIGAEGLQRLLEQNEQRRLQILALERTLTNTQEMLAAKKRLAKK